MTLNPFGKAEPKKNNKAAVAIREAPLEQPATAAPRLSHRAASVAADMEQLEADLQVAHLRATQMENRAMALEQVLVDLRNEVTHLRNECDHYHHSYTDVVSRLKAAGSIIIDVVRGLDQEVAQQPPNQEMLDQAEKALRPTEPAPAPEPQEEAPVIPQFIDKRVPETRQQ